MQQETAAASAPSLATIFGHGVVMTKEEITALTGYKKPGKQLQALHDAGFERARITPLGVVLERSHYESVTSDRHPTLYQTKKRPKVKLLAQKTNS